MRNSRDIGLSHGAGKGDKDRTTNSKVFRERLAAIDWQRHNMLPDGFQRKGRRLVKHYGPAPMRFMSEVVIATIPEGERPATMPILFKRASDNE